MLLLKKAARINFELHCMLSWPGQIISRALNSRTFPTSGWKHCILGAIAQLKSILVSSNKTRHLFLMLSYSACWRHAFASWAWCCPSNISTAWLGYKNKHIGTWIPPDKYGENYQRLQRIIEHGTRWWRANVLTKTIQNKYKLVV